MIRHILKKGLLKVSKIEGERKAVSLFLMFPLAADTNKTDNLCFCLQNLLMWGFKILGVWFEMLQMFKRTRVSNTK